MNKVRELGRDLLGLMLVTLLTFLGSNVVPALQGSGQTWAVIVAAGLTALLGILTPLTRRYGATWGLPKLMTFTREKATADYSGTYDDSATDTVPCPHL